MEYEISKYDHITQEVQDWWLKQKETIAALKNMGAEKFFGRIPEIEKAFKPKDRFVRCIDERTPGGIIHLAGSGILLPLEEAKKILMSANAEGIFSHSDCGACKIYAEQNNLDVSTPEKLDQVAIEWARSLAKDAGLPYKGHLKPEINFHNAIVIYFDSVGGFDSSQVDLLPPGFTISRKFLPLSYALRELEIAINIALGDYGFGQRFNSDYPLIVINIASKKENEIWEKEIKKITNRFGGAVLVDKFNWPQ